MKLPVIIRAIGGGKASLGKTASRIGKFSLGIRIKSPICLGGEKIFSFANYSTFSYTVGMRIVKLFKTIGRKLFYFIVGLILVVLLIIRLIYEVGQWFGPL